MDISYREIIQRCKQDVSDLRFALAMAERVTRWLHDRGVKVAERMFYLCARPRWEHSLFMNIMFMVHEWVMIDYGVTLNFKATREDYHIH